MNVIFYKKQIDCKSKFTYGHTTKTKKKKEGRKREGRKERRNEKKKEELDRWIISGRSFLEIGPLVLTVSVSLNGSMCRPSSVSIPVFSPDL